MQRRISEWTRYQLNKPPHHLALYEHQGRYYVQYVRETSYLEALRLYEAIARGVLKEQVDVWI